MQYHYFQEEVFNSHLHLLTNCSKEQLHIFIRRKLKDKTINLDDVAKFSGCYFGLEKDGQTKQFIWIEKFDWSVTSQSLLVHELTHFVMAVFNADGVPISKENEETFAYFLGYMVKTIFWKIRKLNPIYKKKIK